MFIGAVFSTNALSLGRLDVASLGRYAGWACKPGSSETVKVRIVRDDGAVLTTSLANKLREPAVQAACGSSHSAHGFDVAVNMTGLITNKSHSVSFYVVYGDGSTAPLSNSPIRQDFGSPNTPAPASPPLKLGAIVGRNFVGKVAGHIGIWDGEKVVEIMNDGPTTNNVEQNTWSNFIGRNKPWPVVYPRYPTYTIADCYEASCRITVRGASLTLENSRKVMVSEALVRRAWQIKRVGATYNYTGSASSSFPARTIKDCDSRGCDTEYHKAVRGSYRCDTFVLELFKSSVRSQWFFSDSVPIYTVTATTNAWMDRVYSLWGGYILPAQVYERIKLL